MDAKSPLAGMVLPEQTLTKATQVEMQPDAVRKWRSTLPMADMGMTSKKFYLTLKESNQIDMPVADRYEILELFRPTVQYICQALRKHYINQLTQLNKQKLTIANLAQTLQVEMALGYKLVLRDLDKEGNVSLDDLAPKRLKAKVIHRCMHYLTHVLLRCYQLYSTAPDGIWQDLHSLYAYADQQGLLEEELEVNKGKDVKRLRVMETYEHSLLLAATCPYQWRQTEQELINNALDAWAGYTKIIKNVPTDHQVGYYIFDLQQDKSPVPLSLGKMAPTETCQALDLSDLVIHLQELLSKVEKDEISARMKHDSEPEFAVSPPILRRLIKSWTTNLKRINRRFDHDAAMRATFGLSATHYYINNERIFNATLGEDLDDEEDDDEDDLILAAPIESTHIKGDVEDVQVLGEDVDLGAVPLPDSSSRQVSMYPTYVCMLKNISPCGYCLIWEDDSYPPLQAGEIIGMQFAVSAGSDTWSLGVVRWLRRLDENKLRIGVEMLAPYAKAAGIQVVKDGKTAGFYLRCLVLPRMEGMGQMATVITTTLPFKEDHRVAIVSEDNPREPLSAELTRLVDATGSFKLFEFVPYDPNAENVTPVDFAELEEEEEIEHETPSAPPKEYDEFDSIWTSL